MTGRATVQEEGGASRAGGPAAARKRAAPARHWSIPLSQREARAFTTMCATQGVTPELALRRLVQGYIVKGGQEAPAVDDFDALLTGYLDWCFGPLPPADAQPVAARPQRARG